MAESEKKFSVPKDLSDRILRFIEVAKNTGKIRKGMIEYNQMINQSRITVGMSHFNNVDYYTSNRLYQCMATGVPHIAWHAPRIAEYFNAGYLEVDSYEQMEKVLDLFLSSKFWRHTVGRAQYRETLKDHTLACAWDRMKAIIKNVLK